MQICVRVDASGRIGLGHIKRCLSLADALREAGAQVTFACRQLGVDVAALLQASGFASHLLDKPATSHTIGAAAAHADWAGVPQAQDAAETIATLRPLGKVDWVIVDHYAFDATWHEQVAQGLSTRIAVIDDLADRPLAADLLIDHNLSGNHQNKYQGRISQSTPLLGGPRFALLGSGYQRAPRYDFHELVRSIGIFLGGTDPGNFSVNALRACREVAGFKGPVEVVSTSSNPHLASITHECGQWPATSIATDLPDLAAFFARHDLHIGAGGGATWERCCIGAPTLGLICADNQRMVLPQLAELGAVAVPEDNQPSAIGRSLLELMAHPAQRQSLSRKAMALVDGRGAQRVALQLLAPTLSLRPATRGDAQRLYAWRNDERTRSVSKDASAIAFESHTLWLDSVLADPDRSLWVAFVGKLAVGSIRFDRSGANRFTVSLYLDPALHGLGLGRNLLHCGEQTLSRNATGPIQLDAEVLATNAVSRRLFESAHYSGQGLRLSKRISACA